MSQFSLEPNGIKLRERNSSSNIKNMEACTQSSYNWYLVFICEMITHFVKSSSALYSHFANTAQKPSLCRNLLLITYQISNKLPQQSLILTCRNITYDDSVLQQVCTRRSININSEWHRGTIWRQRYRSTLD